MQSTVELLAIDNSEYFDAETRRYYDTVTWLAEVMPGNMRTPFEYTYYGGELYAQDGSAMGRIFDDSIEGAKSLPLYERRRREIEKGEYLDMLAMMKGDKPNTIVVESDFPLELMDVTEDVGGYNVSRKQTMLRVLAKTPQGTLKMFSQSLDGSNRRGLEAIYEYFGQKPAPGELLGQRIFVELDSSSQELIIDNLTNVYDRSLHAQYGGEWNAGRASGVDRNTYDFVCGQQDLIKAYLAITKSFTGGFRDYSLAAAIKDRFLCKKLVESTEYVEAGVVAHTMAVDEMYRAGNAAQARGEVFSGCGASVSRDYNSKSAEAQLDGSGYGNQANKSLSDSETLVWKDGVCRVDNCPTRPGKTKVAQCSVCRCCQLWFDKGRDPAKLYKGMKRIQKESFTTTFVNKKETKIKKINP